MKRTPVKRVNRARRAKNHARAYGGAERIRFVKSLPCIACLRPGLPCENAHIETGGMGRKSDADKVVPLCIYHHCDLHQFGRRWFERLHYGLDLSHAAAETERLWQQHLAEQKSAE